MGKCISRSTSAAKDDDAANEPKDEVKNNSAEAKPKNEKTANGQLDTNRADETHEEPNSNATSTADAKTEATSKETKSAKETKTVRITEAKTSEVNVERQKSDDPVQSTKPEDVAVDLNDPEVQKAATTIQAGFRGHQTRKQLKSSPDNHQESANDLDIDLNDPEVNKAAVKIQASFRGHITRKNMQNN